MFNPFGCSHSNHTWPQRRGTVTYVTCTECGREFPYEVGKGITGKAIRIALPVTPKSPERVENMEDILTQIESAVLQNMPCETEAIQ